MRLLTKSLFKLGLDCSSKLYFYKKPEYANTQKEDAFLDGLAEGGYQVEQLAKAYYPNGIEITGNNEEAVALTKEHLNNKNVTLFEAAFQYNNLFVRVDILEKKGNKINLIEVKAKSIDPEDQFTFVGKRGGVVPSWIPYLYDVAFQKYVINKTLPDLRVNTYFLLANKRSRTTVNGLNQLFRIVKDKKGFYDLVKTKTITKELLGDKILHQADINFYIDGIINNSLTKNPNLPVFKYLVETFSEAVMKDEKIIAPISIKCKTCQFQDPDHNTGLLSGLKECWDHLLHWNEEDYNDPLIFNISNFKKAGNLIAQGKIKMTDLEEGDINIKEEAGRLSQSSRQIIQIEKAINKDDDPLILIEELKEEMNSWNFPLNFIDFETATMAIPFTVNRRPYEQIAFQFSHHTVFEDGKIEHSTEYICDKAGIFPNFEFIRELKDCLTKNEGTIFQYSKHENTVLNAIYMQLLESEETDKDELMDFVQHISRSKKDATIKWEGARCMVDLCEVVKNFYYTPKTNGSSSIKYILPAIIEESNFLKNKYSKAISEIDISSMNFSPDKVFLNIEKDSALNPYADLQNLFEDWSPEQLDQMVSNLDLDSAVNNGGMALMAYAKLQFEEMTSSERNEIKKALLRYCEIDTLAMVMIYEYFAELTK